MSELRKEFWALVGPEVAAALRNWERVTGWRTRPLVRLWHVDGQYTGSKLVALCVERRGVAPMKVIVKLCPPPYRREPSAHARALADSPPEFAKAHLVDQPFEPLLLANGGALMFQQIAGGGLQGYGPITDLPDDAIVPAVESVFKDLVFVWNDGMYERCSDHVADILRSHLRQQSYAGSAPYWVALADRVDMESGWITTAEDDEPLPNPHMMIEGQVGACPVDYLVGLVHGDLHAQNILVEQKPKLRRKRKYWMIDLSAYHDKASLTHDPVTLLLSLAAHHFRQLTGSQREALLLSVIDPWDRASDRLPGMLQRLVRRVAHVTPSSVGTNGWADEWRAQFLLAVVACAFAFTGYEDLTPECRWWFFRLAAHAGREFLRGQGLYMPVDARRIDNPFSSPSVGWVVG